MEIDTGSLDTGSLVCVIPWVMYNRHCEKWPEIKKTNLRLSSYLEPLPIAGKLTLPISYDGKTVTASMTVVCHSGPCLCGHDLLRALNNLGAPVLSLSSASRRDGKELKAILSEYEGVFKEELGLFKVPPVHLYVKGEAVLKFFKVRPCHMHCETYALRKS